MNSGESFKKGPKLIQSDSLCNSYMEPLAKGAFFDDDCLEDVDEEEP
eukprot:CAMPEP_0170540246 /NCGR_PEP_ID=MMETSP0211-20121228/279_1 /TAXON_ID=311385 /ORGANISM="Pseudokeronopsis sp., Strain OXSARD2" /LENGTH=46 /DNA_ID= /DNA_START= /DNA_END= /DNA_ORIENTATION=